LGGNNVRIIRNKKKGCVKAGIALKSQIVDPSAALNIFAI